MLKTVVCDDEPPALELMTGLLEATGMVSIEAASGSVRAVLDLINRGGIDLLVLDVEMPELSGVEAYGHITVDPKPLLVFATAHPDYAVDAFGIDAIDYILKPLEAGRVRKAVEKAARLHGLIRDATMEAPAAFVQTDPKPHDNTLRIRDAGRVYLIPFADMIWIEAAGDYSLLHTHERQTVIRRTMSSLEAELPGDAFVRVHRSAIVSKSRIREIRMLAKGEAEILLDGAGVVRSSRTYRDTVRALIASP
jgi:two-component system, LytTR family, response regulator